MKTTFRGSVDCRRPASGRQSVSSDFGRPRSPHFPHSLPPRTCSAFVSFDTTPAALGPRFFFLLLSSFASPSPSPWDVRPSVSPSQRLFWDVAAAGQVAPEAEVYDVTYWQAIMHYDQLYSSVFSRTVGRSQISMDVTARARAQARTHTHQHTRAGAS